MILYRYMKSHWLETLRDGCFKMSKISNFNDPFDGRGRCVGRLRKDVVKRFIQETNSEVNGVLKLTELMSGAKSSNEILERIAEQYTAGFYKSVQDRSMFNIITYVLCFSSCHNNDPAQRLMWAHYANGYRGVRIGVKLDDPNFPLYLDSVKYCSERPVLNLSKVEALENDKEVLNFWISNLTTKSTEWAYEQEVRLIADDKHLEKWADGRGDDTYFWRFMPTDIVSIDLGFEFPQSEIDNVIELQKEKYPQMKVSQVVLDNDAYGIEYRDVK